MVREVTGWNVSLWELLKVGERRLNLLQAFNAREGVGAEADTVPPSLLIPLEGGESDGVAVTAEEVEKAKSIYCRMVGWDEDDRPRRGKLEELALGDASCLPPNSSAPPRISMGGVTKKLRIWPAQPRFTV